VRFCADDQRGLCVGDSVASAPASITVVRPGALGDTLLTLPALALLRHWAPDAQITLIARDDCRSLLFRAGCADAGWSWDLPDWSALFADPPAMPSPLAKAALAEADLTIVWLADPTGAIARSLSVLGARRSLVAAPLPPVEQRTHVALWLAQTLLPLGLPAVSLAELVTLAHTHIERVTVAAVEEPAIIALHPGAGSPRKRWPTPRFAELAQRARVAGYTPLLLCGPADEAAVAATQAALRGRGGPVAQANNFPLVALARLLSRCAGFVGNDSGVSHLAGLVGVPTVALFGPTDPARWSPLGPRVQALRAPDAQLTSLSVDEVWQALGRALAAHQAGG